ncbi:hypothetical protein HC752_07545 [Vibrio sp. S9_S30]|uniref:hypothetical protein n=1 Tax=Vibrio sp. S9_S30 TaxID=2720226 RepID=UPI001680A99C|nr:hypothetical protein [Vibrio sp. S9_S30]MBD1556787.1 hypothetical protein [Vibrio sp. S9_S30]
MYSNLVISYVIPDAEMWLSDRHTYTELVQPLRETLYVVSFEYAAVLKAKHIPFLLTDLLDPTILALFEKSTFGGKTLFWYMNTKSLYK